MGKSRGLAFWAVVTLAAALVAGRGARADVTCTNTSGPPGGEITATITIESPDAGEVLTACSETAVVSGRWSSNQPLESYDIYIVIDNSGSTSSSSGADVNGDGIIGGVGDDVLHAEIAAARAYVAALPPMRARVSIITFETSAAVRHALTSDLTAVIATLDSLRTTLSPGGSTCYTCAMSVVEAQVGLLGNPTHRQLCPFLSDGQPNESLSETNASATDLAALGVTIDTFALGAISSDALEQMAAISGGTFTALTVPGDIVAVLPTTLAALEDFTYAIGSSSGDVQPAGDGTFTVTVPITPGDNHVELTLTIGDPNTVTVSCAVDFSTGELSQPVAYVSSPACDGSTLVLDGSRTLTSCASTVYRWLDCNGDEVCAPSTDPTCTVTCGGCATYTLETHCDGGSCVLTDTVAGTCTTFPPAPVPVVTRSCELSTLVSCGQPNGAASWFWDIDTAVDSDGDGDASHDADRVGCVTTLVSSAPETLEMEVWAANGPCRVSAPLVVAVDPTPDLTARGGPDLTICSGDTVRLDGWASTTSYGTMTYRWLDCSGVELAPASTNPMIEVSPCGVCTAYTLELSTLESPACTATDSITVSCLAVAQPVPTATQGCGREVRLACGTSGTGMSFQWDLDPGFDTNLNGDPLDDTDAVGCNVTATFPTTGLHTVISWGRRGGCALSVPLTFDIAPNVAVVAEAGGPITNCGSSVTLDGSLSTTTVGTLEYRWMSSGGSELRTWSADPRYTRTCSNTSYLLQVRSTAALACFDQDTVTVTCIAAPAPPAPAYLGPCGPDLARVTCGASGGATFGWDLAIGLDADGNGDPMDDADLVGCDQQIPLPPGRWPVVAWARSGACATSQRLDIDFWPPSPRDLSGGACAGHPIVLDCGTIEPGAVAWWDIDPLVDADADGNPENDADASGCQVVFTGASGTAEVRGWVEDVPGCVRLVAFGTIEVSSSLPPGEATGLRVDQILGAGDDNAAWMSWDITPDADSYRVLRGAIDELWTMRDYDHRADPDLAIGACSVPSASYAAVGERLGAGSFYYLVTAVTDCGGEGPTGHAWTPASQPERPARIPTMSCP